MITLCAASVAWAVCAAEPSFVSGNIRVEFLGPDLIRLEERGPKGFEDRTTFHVAQRPKPMTRIKVVQGKDGKSFSNGKWTVVVPVVGGIDAVKVSDARGHLAFAGAQSGTNSEWLPQPGDKSPAWSFTDSPRIVPPAWGLKPAPDASVPLAGWDTGNDARDVYVFLNANRYQSLRQDFLNLTGHSEVPPLWAFGLWQSRYHPYSQRQVLDLAKRYEDAKMPLSVFVIDTDWRVGASIGYDENKKLFPDMTQLFAQLHQMGIRSVFNDHPEPQAKTALDPKELAYRQAGLSRWIRAGLDAWWYDRNWMTGLVEPLPGLRKEVWGMKLYRDITEWARPGVRPMIMANVDGIDNGKRNRPPNVAAHRYPIQWTGDTSANWSFLRAGVENAVFSGVRTTFGYMSEDLGGHIGNPDRELYTRFMQYGALSPVMRLHYTAGMKNREPWEYGSEVEGIVRDYVHLRTALTPVFYAAAHASHETGEPILRRCDLEFGPISGAARDDQYLLGDGLLVAPIMDGPEWHVAPADRFSKGLVGSFFGNDKLEGAPIAEVKAANVNAHWGIGAPTAGVAADHFSDRWEGEYMNPSSAPVELAVRSDDGARLWINDKLVADSWGPAYEVLVRSNRKIAPGERVKIRLEHMELEGGSMLQLLEQTQADAVPQRTVWVPPGQWRDLWSGKTLAGPATVTVKAPLRQLPMFQREGSVIATVAPDADPLRKPWSVIDLHCWPSRMRGSTTVLVDDDRTSQAYLQGKKCTIKVTLSPIRKGHWSVSVSQSGPASLQIPRTIRIWTPSGAVSTIPLLGEGEKRVGSMKLRVSGSAVLRR